MYNVPFGRSRIVSKTRRGMNRSMGRQDSQSTGAKTNGEQSNGPRSMPVFNTDGGRKFRRSDGQKPWSPEYTQVVQFAQETWNTVWVDYQEHLRNNTLGPDTVMYYEEKTPCKALKNFKPFDIEAWWSKQLYDKIVRNTPKTNEVP